MAIAVPADIVRAAIDGGREHVDELIRAVWPDAYLLARAILGDRQGAEDAAQEACVILYRQIGSLRDEVAFNAWFYRIVVREASSIRRRASRQPASVETMPDSADETASLDVWRALATLPDRLREVVVLHYFEDLSSRAIASILDVPEGTVRFRLMVARRRLRPLLGDDAPTLTETANEVRTDVG